MAGRLYNIGGALGPGMGIRGRAAFSSLPIPTQSAPAETSMASESLPASTPQPTPLGSSPDASEVPDVQASATSLPAVAPESTQIPQSSMASMTSISQIPQSSATPSASSLVVSSVASSAPPSTALISSTPVRAPLSVVLSIPISIPLLSTPTSSALLIAPSPSTTSLVGGQMVSQTTLVTSFITSSTTLTESIATSIELEPSPESSSSPSSSMYDPLPTTLDIAPTTDLPTAPLSTETTPAVLTAGKDNQLIQSQNSGSSHKSNGLSTAAIAGIAGGISAAVLIVATMFVLRRVWRSRRQATEESSEKLDSTFGTGRAEGAGSTDKLMRWNKGLSGYHAPRLSQAYKAYRM